MVNALSDCVEKSRSKCLSASENDDKEWRVTSSEIENEEKTECKVLDRLLDGRVFVIDRWSGIEPLNCEWQSECGQNENLNEQHAKQSWFNTTDVRRVGRQSLWMDTMSSKLTNVVSSEKTKERYQS